MIAGIVLSLLIGSTQEEIAQRRAWLEYAFDCKKDNECVITFEKNPPDNEDTAYVRFKNDPDFPVIMVYADGFWGLEGE
jgi:hypothetical protein